MGVVIVKAEPGGLRAVGFKRQMLSHSGWGYGCPSGWVIQRASRAVLAGEYRAYLRDLLLLLRKERLEEGDRKVPGAEPGALTSRPSATACAMSQQRSAPA
jgi:hypothetical protein